MEGLITPRNEKTSYSVFCTSLLACFWGGGAAYILCYSLLITHNNRLAITALLPLVAVWATLERKRWGRLALMGLSLTTVGLFLIAMTLLTIFPYPAQFAEVQSLAKFLSSLEAAYGISTQAVLGMLLLAAVTGSWLWHPRVIAEFDQHKRHTLAKAQRAIATVLVGCWGAAIALNPLLTIDKARGISGRRSMDTSPRARGKHIALRYGSHSLSSIPSRSAHSFSRP